MFNCFRRNRGDSPTEREKITRLEQAEAEVADLVARSERAIGYLTPRRGRNHWRESITEMIQGA